MVAERDPRRALETFLERQDSFHVILTDERMLGMSGTELAAKIHRLRPRLPIVVVTGFSTTVDDTALEDAGVTTVLQKPLTTRALAISIRKVLDAKE